MKWILITGGTGFIGTNLCKRLLAEGKHVLALDNHSTSPIANSLLFQNNRNYHFIKHDITQPFPQTVFSDYAIETIFHLACPTGVTNLVPFAEEMLLACSIGTKHVLDLARFHTAQVLFASSSEVYGDPQVFPQSENYTGNVSTTGVRSPYEEGKRFSESLVQLYVQKYQLNAKSVRIFNTYGPYMSSQDTRVIPRFLQQIREGRPLTLQGDGLHTRTFCYVDDLLEGFFCILQKGNTGEIYNLGSDQEITIRALAQQIIRFTKKNTIVSVSPVAHDHKRRLPALQKVHALGWQQTVALSEGLRRTVEWYG